MVYRKSYKKTMSKGSKGKKTYKKYGKKKGKSSPPVDIVVTRNFKFVGTTNLTINQGCVIGNVKNFTASDNMGFRPSDFPGLLDFQKIFTHFRFESISLRFIPVTVTLQVEDNDVGTSASGISKATPIIYLSRVYGNEQVGEFTYVNENSALIDGAKSAKMTRPIYMKFVPNFLTPVGTSRAPTASSGTQPATTGWVAQKKQWLSMNDTKTIFYGVKWLTSATTSDDNEYLYKLIVTAKFSFKGKNDSAYDTVSGSVYNTVQIPFTALTT